MLLRALVNRSDRKNKGEIIECLSFFVEQSKRNVFAHSFARSSEENVTFVTRDNHGKFKVTEHSFTPSEFGAHVNAFIDVAKAFEKEVGLTRENIEAFSYAATGLASKA